MAKTLKTPKKSTATTRMKKHERLRLFMQALAFAFQNGYVAGWTHGKIYSGENKAYCVPGLNCYSCPGAVGSCPIGSLQAVLDSGVYHFSLYVIGFIGIIGVLCGRLVCGWICPFGWVQDLLYRIPVFKKVKNLPGHRYLKWLKYVVLVVLVIALPQLILGPAGTGEPWFCKYLCPSGTLFGGIPLLIANESLRESVGLLFAWKLCVLLLLLLGAVKFYRPFCKYLCPLGALYGCANPVSLYRLSVDKDKCIQCGSCQKTCGMDIKTWETPNSLECIRCGKCRVECPTGAITSSLDDLTKVLTTRGAHACEAGAPDTAPTTSGSKGGASSHD